MEPEKTSGPPLVRLKLRDGVVIYPKMKQEEDGNWVVADPELIKGLINGSPKGANRREPPPLDIRQARK